MDNILSRLDFDKTISNMKEMEGTL